MFHFIVQASAVGIMPPTGKQSFTVAYQPPISIGTSKKLFTSQVSVSAILLSSVGFNAHTVVCTPASFWLQAQAPVYNALFSNIDLI